MYLANLEHVATGYPKQCEISFFEYAMFKIAPNKFLNRLERKFDFQLDYEFFFNGVTNDNR